MNTTTNHRPVTKAWPFKSTLYKWYCLDLFTCEPSIILGRYKLSPYRNYYKIFLLSILWVMSLSMYIVKQLFIYWSFIWLIYFKFFKIKMCFFYDLRLTNFYFCLSGLSKKKKKKSQILDQIGLLLSFFCV